MKLTSQTNKFAFLFVIAALLLGVSLAYAMIYDANAASNPQGWRQGPVDGLNDPHDVNSDLAIYNTHLNIEKWLDGKKINRLEHPNQNGLSLINRTNNKGVSVVTANMAPNPSFEQGASTPDGWEYRLSGAIYSWNSSVSRTGSHSICISNIQANHSVEWETLARIPVQPGVSYNFGVWVKGNSDRGAYYSVAPLDFNGNWLTGVAIYIPYNNTSWSYQSYAYTAQPNAAYVELLLGVNNPGGFTSSSVCFDDVLFETQPATCPMPFFSQRDPRWINHPLRTNGICSSSCGTIGACGCTLTSATMLFDFYGANLTPPQLSDCMGNLACPFYWGTGASCSGEKAIWGGRFPFSWERLDNELNQNHHPVILGMHRKGNSNQTHWVLVTSGHGSNASGYTMHDPWFLGGANMNLNSRAGNYDFDWISIYSGQPSCGVTRTNDDNQINPHPAIFSSVEISGDLETEIIGSPSSVISGSVMVYRMYDITMTVQVSATSSVGNIIEMQVWTDSNPTPVWQPFETLVYMPVSDFVYARFRDELSNISEDTTDSIFPSVSPPPEPELKYIVLPIIFR